MRAFRLHRRCPHRWMQILAVLAVVLLLAAPLVSRAVLYPPLAVAAAATMAGHAHGDGHAMPSGMHMQHMQHMAAMGPMQHMDPTAMQVPQAAHQHPAPADPHAGHDMGVDCEYCAIAARMTALLLAVLWLLTLWSPPRRALAGLARPHRSLPLRAYAARGPPLLAA